MARKATAGSLVIIGGREDKKGDCAILKEVVARSRSGPMVIATVASRLADELWEEYRACFEQLGVEEFLHLDMDRRDAALDPAFCEFIRGASCVFLTGGDQLRITSKLGGTRLAVEIEAVLARGGVVAGTSAGASVMSETMLVSGLSEGSLKVSDSLKMAPGLGFMPDVLIDQHFAQRGRMGRLLAAVAQNPRILGIGIDEDTAIVVQEGRPFEVLGSGAVYIADGQPVSHTNLYEQTGDHIVSVFDVRVHVLSAGDQFDLGNRRPIAGPPCPPPG